MVKTQGREKRHLIYFMIKAAIKVSFFQGIFNLLISAAKTVDIPAKNVSQLKGTDFIKMCLQLEVLAICTDLVWFFFYFKIQDNQ